VAPLKRNLAPPAAQRKAARAEATRMGLFEAAGRVIGRYGYAGCSIARVTAKAKIAHGSFYLYFGSQKELFSEIRSALGQKMLTEVFKSVGAVTSVRDLEGQYIRASLAYFKKHPYMYTVMATSERAGSIRDLEHMRSQVDFYVERLRPLIGSAFSDAYLEALTVMIMGVRSNILRVYGLKDNVMLPPPDAAIEVYLNFIAAGAASPENLRATDWSLGGVSNLDGGPRPARASAGAGARAEAEAEATPPHRPARRKAVAKA
jgi:AcrR family transcriptional regulator